MLTIILCAIVLLVYSLATKYTVLGLSVTNGQLSGGLFLLNLLIFIIPTVIIIQFIDVSQSSVLFYVAQDSIFATNSIILYGLFVFLGSFGIFWRIFVGSKKYSRPQLEIAITRHQKEIYYLYYAILVLLYTAIIVVMVGLGAKHAFYEAIIGPTSAGAIRHQNAAINNLSYLKHFIALHCVLLAVIIATRAFDRNKIARFFGITSILICGTFYGSKSPLIFYTIIFILSYIESHGNIKRLNFIKKIILLIIISSLFLYIAVYFTYMNSNYNFSFIDYLFNRIFIAQMAGMYEEWNLKIQSINYGYHMIPFASLFIDYPIFHKDLMMISEGRLDPSSIGIKNTFFLAEAYAIFGYAGLLLAPIFMAFAMLVNYLILIKFFSFIIQSKPISIFLGSYIFVFFFGLTDGISQAMLLKGTVVAILIFLPLMCLSLLLRTTRSFNQPRNLSQSVRKKKINASLS